MSRTIGPETLSATNRKAGKWPVNHEDETGVAQRIERRKRFCTKNLSMAHDCWWRLLVCAPRSSALHVAMPLCWALSVQFSLLTAALAARVGLGEDCDSKRPTRNASTGGPRPSRRPRRPPSGLTIQYGLDQ